MQMSAAKIYTMTGTDVTGEQRHQMPSPKAMTPVSIGIHQ